MILLRFWKRLSTHTKKEYAFWKAKVQITTAKSKRSRIIDCFSQKKHNLYILK